MIQIKGLDHVVLRVQDIDSMTRFYCDVLGCKIERELSPAFGLVQLRAGNSLIDLASVDGELGRLGGAAPGKEGRNMDHFCVILQDFEEVKIRSHLSMFNITGSNIETRYGAEGSGPSMYIQDPENNTVELKGPPY